MSRRRTRALAPLAVLVASLLAGCVSLPTDGPVVEGGARGEKEAPSASDIDARPPADGASRAEVVAGFLDAMAAWPIQTSVAKEYLTDAAAERWIPEQATVVYSDALPVREVGGSVEVQLTTADRLDQVGAWEGAVAKDDLTYDFRVTVEDGEFRIANPADALVVPATWFQQRFRQVSLYYFDPVAQILVPEPVFVPAGEQSATHLVSALLAGPPSSARGIVRSFLPPGLTVGLSVPVDGDGVADINLVGDAPRITAEEAELILSQLAWTLRQDPAVTALRVTADGEPLPIPGGASQYPVEGPDDFDPNGADVASSLFGISRGRLVRTLSGGPQPVAGAFYADGVVIDAVAARPDGDVVAVVDQEGTRVQVGPPSGDQAPETILSGGSYARPTWDVAGRLWVLERRSGGAVVWLREDDVVREVRVPGITGRPARQLIVSRDGTRLVGVVAIGSGDEVVGARVQIDDRGRVARALDRSRILLTDRSRITDLAWAGPMRLALLAPTDPGRLYEVDIVAADGATVGVELLSTIVSGHVLGITGTPVDGGRTFLVYRDRYVDLVQQDETDAESTPLTQLDYVG
ncbi:LpqB family beta-propeller domain-containing protein [Nocardioides caeni]|uniref:GerMN domain-containing protein n=1 Tax=Nocardioides caeni TaxID=574700 RepID=A0A4S8NPT1_9ACTN|nr:LpqB family beta-propeller domain-containing protein [Nocardioides caeni]THV18222.1 hypothetical protein E9934_00815 [Nocardioides caeni]